jgi:hypothetical protein
MIIQTIVGTMNNDNTAAVMVIGITPKDFIAISDPSNVYHAAFPFVDQLQGNEQNDLQRVTVFRCDDQADFDARVEHLYGEMAVTTRKEGSIEPQEEGF